MRKGFLFFIITILAQTVASQQSVPSMDNYYRTPVVEPGDRNIILQNRCGNRLTVMLFKDSAGLEFIYKPNAYRRKDLWARNFSNRDNFTVLFPTFGLPDIKEADVKSYEYDPFVTTLGLETPHGAKNEITFVNIADENAFAIAAKAPLLLSFKPHNQFKESDGLLTESFHDRGEDIVSFVKFAGNRTNRFRRKADGSYIIQIFENEVVLIGGEENQYQVDRVLSEWDGIGLKELITRNEAILNVAMNKGLLTHNNSEFQEVIDVNHRLVYSGIDEGGACFGALNRIYHLIWVRDGSMTSALMARAGNPELINIWAPFLLANPSYMKDQDGKTHPEFLQLVGTRWTKSEPDGLYYAVWSLFNYFQSTGKDDLLYKPEFETILSAIDYYLKNNYDKDEKLIVTDTWGETPLKSNPYFGYDVVNGNYEYNDHHMANGKEVGSTATFYNNINTWNVLQMMLVLLEQRPEYKSALEEQYKAVIKDLEESINTKFVDPKTQIYYRCKMYYTDGSTEWLGIGENPWEFSWAQSLGPYFPDIPRAVATAKAIKEEWARQDDYGFCPWNCLGNVLYEYGMSSDEHEQMLTAEVEHALLLTEKYPMPGGITEYKDRLNSWRSLPFSAGSFFFSVSGQILQSLPLGIAVRASDKVDSLSNFQYQLSRFQVKASGEGDEVEQYSLNGEIIEHTLQIPYDKIKAGNNVLTTKRTASYDQPRLYSSTAQLIRVREENGSILYEMNNPIGTDVVFEHLDKVEKIEVRDINGKLLEHSAQDVEGSLLSVVNIPSEGMFTITISK